MTDRKRVQRLVFSERVCGGVALRSEPLLLVPLTKEVSLGGRREGITGGFQVLSKENKPCFYVRLVPKLFYKCDQGQADAVVAMARGQSSVHLKPLMHEAQPPSHFSASTITRYPC